MVAAAPLAIVAAEALEGAIVYVGSALAAAVGITAAADAVDKEFGESAPEAVKTCTADKARPPDDPCGELEELKS